MSRPKKRSFSIKGHRTSLSLEEPFWDALREIAFIKGLTMAALVTHIDANRGNTGLSTALRVFILGHYRNQAGSNDLPDGAEIPTNEDANKRHTAR